MAALIWRVPEEELSRACTLDEEPEPSTPVSVRACALAIAMQSAAVRACALVLAAVLEPVLVRACGPAWVAALFQEQVAAKALRQRAVAMQAAQPQGREPMVQ